VDSGKKPVIPKISCRVFSRNLFLKFLTLEMFLVSKVDICVAIFRAFSSKIKTLQNAWFQKYTLLTLTADLKSVTLLRFHCTKPDKFAFNSFSLKLQTAQLALNMFYSLFNVFSLKRKSGLMFLFQNLCFDN